MAIALVLVNLILKFFKEGDLKMKTNILRIIGFVMALLISFVPLHADEADISSTEEKEVAEDSVRFLEPEIIDNFFTKYLGEPIDELTGGFKFGVTEIPILDESLDKVGEISPIDLELGFSVVNAYIWRGQKLGSDASWQPYVTASPDFEPFGDVSFTFWADITQNSLGENQREYDFVVDYNFSILEGLELIGYKKEESPYLLTKALDFTFDTGYIYYKFPPQPDTKTQEVYFGVEYNLPLSPSFYIYNDWDRGSGAWLSWGIAQDIDLGVITLSTYATLNYNKGQWGADSQLSTLDFGASIPVELGKHMVIEPFLSYTKELDDDGANMVNDEIYGGFNWSISF